MCIIQARRGHFEVVNLDQLKDFVEYMLEEELFHLTRIQRAHIRKKFDMVRE